MNADTLAYDILLSLDIAVLKRTGPHEYILYGRAPEFYLNTFPSEEDGTPCRSPWLYSHMIDFFLDDAELFFKRNIPGKIYSGIWQEVGVCGLEQALSATAVVTEHDRVIILRLLEDDFTDRARILQKAREQLLEQRTLNRDLEMYKHKSRFDGLTTLLNRATFMEVLQKETSRASVLDMDLAMLFMDLDDFKNVNDNYGHLVGDYVLTAFGKILLGSLRSEDIVARYGGEEFAVLAPYTNLGQAQLLAEKLRKNIESYKFDNLPTITLSIGCAAYKFGESIESFIQRADLALYDAKRSGKNVVRIR